ncbi:MAG TPA: MFS transporter, partial [Bryobacteraceae bacterium]|nr:MFS transporter [Bryobacteraceae bacterium]
MQTEARAGVWRLRGALAMMVLSGALNYADRSNLSIGATNIQNDLHLSKYQLGILLSAFFWTYALSQLLNAAGWIVDRWNVGWVLMGGVALWSFATGACGLAHSLALLFALRFLVGAGESIAYPSYGRIIVNCFDERHRGFSNAAIDAGTKLGPALGASLGGLLIPRYGWRIFFVVLGACGLLWAIAWMFSMPQSPRLSAGLKTKVDVGEILRLPELWWTSLGLFGSNYFWYFLITWLPPYLEDERGFPKEKMAAFSTMSYLAIALSSVSSGWLSDRWIARGGSPTRVRRTFAVGGLAFSTILLGVQMVSGETAAMALLLIASVSFGAYASNVFAITQTLAGPAASGRWTSIQNGIGNLAGVAAPWFTGWVAQYTGSFFFAFLAATMAVILSAMTY